MHKVLKVAFVENEPDMLGNCENVKTSVTFFGDDSFITMTFGGRDGSADKSISLDDLRKVFNELGKETMTLRKH